MVRRNVLAALAVVAALGGLTPAARAQGLPTYHPLNPTLTSRSALFFQPYVDANGAWEVRTQLDYGNSIEFTDTPNASFVLDAELLRLEGTVIRNLGPTFVGASATINGTYGGFLDGFLDWYHNLTGLSVNARQSRPRNTFAYTLELPDGTTIDRRTSSAFLGDLRLFGGHRHTRHWQTVLALTLPTTTGPTGYGRGTLSIAATTTARVPITGRLTYEGSLGLAFTPRHGDLSKVQRTFFRSISSGVRFRFWGRQAAFVNVFYQSANYRETTVKQLDRRELTIDYGFLLKPRRGPEWFLGMTEDLEPGGPAIDLAFRIGARW